VTGSFKVAIGPGDLIKTGAGRGARKQEKASQVGW